MQRPTVLAFSLGLSPILIVFCLSYNILSLALLWIRITCVILELVFGNASLFFLCPFCPQDGENA